MPRAALLLLAFVCGCSTAPLADFLDITRPARIAPNAPPGRGGVCAPSPVPDPAVPGPADLPPPLDPVRPPSIP